METTASLWTDLTADKGGTVYDSDSALLTTDYSALLTNSALENKSETVGRIFRAGEWGALWASETLPFQLSGPSLFILKPLPCLCNYFGTLCPVTEYNPRPLPYTLLTNYSTLGPHVLLFGFMPQTILPQPDSYEKFKLRVNCIFSAQQVIPTTTPNWYCNAER